MRCAHEFTQLIPDSRLSVYADTGHNAMIERPRRFNAELAAFMTAPSNTPFALAA